MVRHIVLFSLNEGVDRDDPAVLEAFEALAGLEGKIPEIRQWEVGRNFSGRAIAADFALLSSFESREALERYVANPFHQEVVALLKEVCTWKICDHDF